MSMSDEARPDRGTPCEYPETEYIWERMPIPRMSGNHYARPPCAATGRNAPPGYRLHSWHVAGGEIVVCWHYTTAEIEIFSTEEEPLHVRMVEP